MKKTKIKMKEAHFGILYRRTTHAHTEDFIFVQEETLVNANITLILLYFFWLLQHSRTLLSTRSPTLAAPTSAGWQRAVPPQLSASVWADPLHFPEEIRLQPPLRTGAPFGSPRWPGCAHSAPILPPGFQARISSRPSPIPAPTLCQSHWPLLSSGACLLADRRGSAVMFLMLWGEPWVTIRHFCPVFRISASGHQVTLTLGPSIPSSLTIYSNVHRCCVHVH